MNLLKEYKGLSCPTSLFEEEGNKILECVIDDVPYGFNVNCIPEENREWFAQVYSMSLSDLHKTTSKNVEKKILGELFTPFEKYYGKFKREK